MLDLMVDAPNSFASLYRDLVQVYGYPREINCEYLLDVLSGMESSGLIKTMIGDEDETTRLSTLNSIDRSRLSSEYSSWLSRAALADFGFDKLGLWLEITELGRESWKNWTTHFESESIPSDWEADINFESEEMVIVSEKESDAKEVLEKLCVMKKLSPINSSLVVRSVKQYRLRNGGLLPSGVMLTCRFIRQCST